MLSNYKKKSNQKGFTIIEVMIVLAIAGLIMLVVFLAVPTLQRNQRNTGRRADASRIAAAANDFLANANGGLPGPAGNTTDTTLLSRSAGTMSNLATGNMPANTAATAACAATTMSAASGRLSICQGALAAPGFTAPTGDAVVVSTRAQCGTAPGVTVAGSARQMAVLYTVEVQGGRNLACINI